jgi:hypothetical protein
MSDVERSGMSETPSAKRTFVSDQIRGAIEAARRQDEWLVADEPPRLAKSRPNPPGMRRRARRVLAGRGAVLHRASACLDSSARRPCVTLTPARSGFFKPNITTGPLARCAIRATRAPVFRPAGW